MREIDQLDRTKKNIRQKNISLLFFFFSLSTIKTEREKLITKKNRDLVIRPEKKNQKKKKTSNHSCVERD
jgi:hypothetical protein